MGARMFVAAAPSAQFVEELDFLLEPRRGSNPRLRWTRPDGWHLTTAFMAEVPTAAMDRLETGLAEAAAGIAPFPIAVEGGLALPDAINARVLAMAVRQGAAELAHLSDACRSAASRAGVHPDGSRFVPHLTLARHNSGFNATRWLGILDSLPGWRWLVSEIMLVRSHGQGSRYEVADRYPLGGIPD